MTTDTMRAAVGAMSDERIKQIAEEQGSWGVCFGYTIESEFEKPSIPKHAYTFARAIEREIRAALEEGGALARFNECDGADEPDPLERLRFFCSLAMNGRDWMDVEPFFDALAASPTAAPKEEPMTPINRLKHAIESTGLPADYGSKPICEYTSKVCEYFGTDTTCTCTQPGFAGTPPKRWTSDVAAPKEEAPSKERVERMVDNLQRAISEGNAPRLRLAREALLSLAASPLDTQGDAKDAALPISEPKAVTELREALKRWDDATTGRGEDRAWELLKSACSPDTVRAVLAAYDDALSPSLNEGKAKEAQRG